LGGVRIFLGGTFICASLLAGCGGGSGSIAKEYTVGVSVSGLTGAGLVLQLNRGSTLSVDTSGIATFETPLSPGMAYVVSIETQPSSPSQYCSVSNGTGIIGAADVTNVAITCVTSPPATSAGDAAMMYSADGFE
jgi:hypothetical protein